MTPRDLPIVEGLPDLPDAAFDAVADAMDAFERVLPDDAQEHDDASDTFLRCIGFRGRNDSRAWALAGAFACPEAVEHLGDPDKLTVGQTRRLEAVFVGLTLGARLALAAGWTPPIAEEGDG